MKFEDVKSGMILRAGGGQNFDSLLFVKTKEDSGVMINQIRLSTDTKISRVEKPDKVSKRDWGDLMAIFHESVLADENFLRRFVKGVFGIPLRSK